MRHSRPRAYAVLLLSLALLVASTGMATGGETRAPQPASQPQPQPLTTGAAGDGLYDFNRVDEQWTMRDGTTLPVSVFAPVPRTPGETFPAIIVIHGWLMEKSVPCWAAEYYAGRGYVGVAMTMRGWFGADGQIGCMDPELDVRDISDVITLLGQDARFPVLEDEKGPVVGVTGYSMGGCFSYLIAPREDPRPGDPGDPRVRAIVPMHGSFDLTFSLYANGAPKWLWIASLLFGAYMGKMSGFMLNLTAIAADRRLNACQKLSAVMEAVSRLAKRPVSDVNPRLMEIYDIVMRHDMDREEEALQFLRIRSARYWCDEQYDGAVEHPITAAALIICGFNDDLFFANEGLVAFGSCEGPRRLLITDRGHAGDLAAGAGGVLPLDEEGRWMAAQVDAWFDRYLKGADNGVEGEPRICFHRPYDPGRYGQADSYPLPGTSQTTYYLAGNGSGSGRLSPQRPSGGSSQADLYLNLGFSGSLSFPYMKDIMVPFGGGLLDIPTTVKLMDIPCTARGYVSEPLQQDMTIMGAPRVIVYFRGSYPFAELNPYLYEVTPDGKEILVSRGWYVGYDPEVWSLNDTASRPIEMQACCHRFRAGSRIKLRIATADPPQALNDFTPAVILLYRGGGMPSSLVLPVVPGSY